MVTSLPKPNADTRVCAATLLMCMSVIAVADEPQPASQTQDVDITVKELRLISHSMLDKIQGQLEVLVSVTNNTGQPLTLDHTDFAFTFADKPGVVHLGVVGPLLTSRKILAPAHQATGWLGLHLQYPSSDEPPLLLTWAQGNRSVRISLNDALRKSARLNVELLGPDDCLAVVTVKRVIDHLTIWLLNEEFRRLQQQGIQRVVLHADLDPDVAKAAATDAVRSTLNRSANLRNMVAAWLASVSARTDWRRISFRAGVRSPVQFEEFYAVDDSTVDVRRYSAGIPNVYAPDREQAVADALGSVYENVSEERALQDLEHSEPGVRRVALQAGIDRLTPEQLQQVLAGADKRSAAYQALVAENLYRSALPESVQALQTLVRSPTPEVSRAALKSLVRSPASGAVHVLQGFWKDTADEPERRQDIVNAIIAGNDYRHTALLAEFAEQQLSLFSTSSADQTVPGAEEATDEDDDQVAEDTTTSTVAVRSSEPRTLQEVLKFLREQDQSMFEDVARRELLNIIDPKIQDIVLEFVLDAPEADASHLARQYIQQRLPAPKSVAGLTDDERAHLELKYGALGPSSGSRITARLMRTVKQYPDAGYTNRLRELSASRAVSTSVRRDAFQAAIQCATDGQLNDIIDDFIAEEATSSTRTQELLNHLSALNHPRFLDVAADCLVADDGTARAALTTLRNHQSPDAMQVMVDRLEELRQQLESADDPAPVGSDDPADKQEAQNLRPNVPEKRPTASLRKADRDALKLADRILDNLTSRSHNFIHPETHRIVNRLRRSPLKELEQLAMGSTIRLSVSSHPALREKIKEAYGLRTTGHYSEARKLFEAIVAEDPYYVPGYSTLASLNLREGRADAAMENLRQADLLSPEDTHTQSMIALTEIRLGHIERGIQTAEQILSTVPDAPTTLRCDTLYNTACTYGRAIEIESDAAKIVRYTQRAIELLQDCAARENGFSDVSHLLADPDLNVFHDHPEWASLVAQIGENEKKNKNVVP